MGGATDSKDGDGARTGLNLGFYCMHTKTLKAAMEGMTGDDGRDGGGDTEMRGLARNAGKLNAGWASAWRTRLLSRRMRDEPGWRGG